MTKLEDVAFMREKTARSDFSVATDGGENCEENMALNSIILSVHLVLFSPAKMVNTFQFYFLSQFQTVETLRPPSHWMKTL